jgi:hypothetical protein
MRPKLVAVVLCSAAMLGAQAPGASPRALPPPTQIKILRAQLEQARIDAAMKETALRYAALQQQQAKASDAIEKALDEAREVCGAESQLELETMTCMEKEKK